MLKSSRLLFGLTLVASLVGTAIVSAADGVIYIDDLKSFDRALQETPSLRAGRPQARLVTPTTPRPETKKESFLSKLRPSWMRGESKEAARPQASGSRTPSRFDSAVTPAAHVAQRPQTQSKAAPSKRPSPRAGGIAMRRDTQPRTGLLDGLMGTSVSKTTAPKSPVPNRMARPTNQPAKVAARQPMVRTPVASKQPTPRSNLPRVAATPAVMAMTQPARTPATRTPIASPSPITNPFVAEAKVNEAVAIESEPRQFDGMVFVSDADIEKPETTEPKLPLAKLSEVPSPKSPAIEAKGPRLVEAQPVQQTVPQKLVTTPYPMVESPTAVSPAAEREPLQNDREPSERARTLLAEAHALAAQAASLDEHSAIVQRCRYVLAIDESSQAIAYANQLASWSLNKRGEGFVDKGRLVEAEADFLEALRCDATCWRAEHNLAVLEAQRENYESARQRFSRTIELNPAYAKAYCNRAALAVQESDFSTAMRDYAQAIEADPDLAIAHIGRGRVCHMLGHLDQALRHLDAAELLMPQDASIVIGRGDLLVDLGRYGHAKAAYERAIALDPSRPTAYRNLAWMQATCPISEFHDGQAALVNATKGAELAGEEDDIALDTRAAALAATGQFEEAAELQKQAIEIAPESDAKVYRERLTMYERGEVFTSQPIGGVQQTTYTK